jgi:hypothetical protein
MVTCGTLRLEKTYLEIADLAQYSDPHDRWSPPTGICF